MTTPSAPASPIASPIASNAASTAASAPSGTQRGARLRRVTDAPTRVFHALFALSFLGAYLSAESERWRPLHVTLGYTLAGLLAFRLLYGLFGPRQARLGPQLRKLAGLPGWLQQAVQRLASGQVPNWRPGQNLAMTAAVLALLTVALPLTLSGWATYNEVGGGGIADALEELHEFFGNAFLGVVLAHIGLIVGLSLLRRQNQARPMLTGHIDGPGPDLARHNHGALAALLLAAVLAFWAWQWQQFPQGLLPAARGAVAQQPGGEDD